MAMKKKLIKKDNDGLVEDKIDILINQINSNLKDGKIVRASEIDGTFILRRPTGIMSLDIATRGGFPKGVVQLVGAENSGKTALAYQVCKNVQNIYGDDTRIALLMVESFDKSFAKNIGFHIGYSNEEVDMVRKAVGRDLRPEEEEFLRREIGKVYHVFYPTAEILLQAAYELAASNMFQVIVIDSIAAMESIEASEKTLDEHTRGGVAKVLSAFFRKMATIDSDTTVIMINQLRDNMDAGLYGKKYTIPGGRALKHGNFITVLLTSGEKLKKEVGSKEIMYGKEINFALEKGKAGCHDGPRGTYVFHNGELGRPFGFDIEESAFSEGLFYGIIEKEHNTYLLDNEKIAVGKDNAIEVLRTVPGFVERIRSAIYQKEGINIVTRR